MEPSAPIPAAKPRRELRLEDYAAGVKAADRAVLGRAITLIESSRPDHQDLAQELLLRLLPLTGQAYRVGITGVPGVGKSTLIERLGQHLLDLGLSVAVLAVDPSSTASGGSILGDKTRMPQLATAARTFIRPSPSSGSLGGVARKTRETILLCEAAGFDAVLVETVGVGQSEVMVAAMVDFVLMLMLPGAGDELQGIKRGILEVIDLLAINKADGKNLMTAQRSRAQYELALHLIRPPSPPWRPPVVTCSAAEGTGIAELWLAIEEHRRVLSAAGEFSARRERQQRDWMWSLVEDQLLTAFRHHPRVSALLSQCEQAVMAGTLTPTLAARRLLQEFGLSEPRP